MNHLLAALLALALATQLHPLDASRVALSNPATLVVFSSEQLRGFPVLLSWSPDGRQLAIGAVQRNRWANEKSWFYVHTIGDSRLAPVEREPDWAGASWMWKSDLRCPGAPEWRIEVETRVERVSATNAGSAGSVGQNSGDPYGAGFLLGPQGQAIVQGAMQSQQVSTTTMKLKGALVGEFVNTPAMPGLMYLVGTTGPRRHRVRRGEARADADGSRGPPSRGARHEGGPAAGVVSGRDPRGVRRATGAGEVRADGLGRDEALIIRFSFGFQAE